MELTPDELQVVVDSLLVSIQKERTMLISAFELPHSPLREDSIEYYKTRQRRFEQLLEKVKAGAEEHYVYET